MAIAATMTTILLRVIVNSNRLIAGKVGRLYFCGFASQISTIALRITKAKPIETIIIVVDVARLARNGSQSSFSHINTKIIEAALPKAIDTQISSLKVVFARNVRYAPNVRMSPWAKLARRRMPYVSVKPTDASAMMLPTAIPSMVDCRTSSIKKILIELYQKYTGFK